MCASNPFTQSLLFDWTGAYDSGHVLSVEVQPPQLICLSEYEKRLAVMYRNQLESVGK